MFGQGRKGEERCPFWHYILVAASQIVYQYYIAVLDVGILEPESFVSFRDCIHETGGLHGRLLNKTPARVCMTPSAPDMGTGTMEPEYWSESGIHCCTKPGGVREICWLHDEQATSR
jgi:hypothetical protein